MNDDAIDVRELGRDAAEILPNAAEDIFDVLRGFFWECRDEVRAPDLVLRKPRPDEPHQPAEHIRHALPVDPAQHRERPHHDPAKQALERALERQQVGERFALARHLGQLERHDDLAEHLAAFEPRQPALEIGERHFGVDHGCKARRHLGEAFVHVADRAAE